MEKLPQNVRKVLDGLSEDLKSRKSICGASLFGSWSRGDADQTSDIDLLVLDSRDFDYEYVERVDMDSLQMDLDHIPEKWVLKEVHPETDQKFYESDILFDRNGTLTRMKDLMTASYSKPERVEIRTGGYLIDADIHLSRGFSAYNKNDFQSAKVSAIVALEDIGKIIIEVGQTPISNSRFIRALESSAQRLGLDKLSSDYLNIAGLLGLEKERVDGLCISFLHTWREAMRFVEAHSSAVKVLHVRVMNDLNYYARESFLKGMRARADSLIQKGLLAEATHYMTRTTLGMLENLVWLASAMEKRRFDYTVLFERLRTSELLPPEIHERAVEAFFVREVSGREAGDALRRARDIILAMRRRRRGLILTLPS